MEKNADEKIRGEISVKNRDKKRRWMEGNRNSYVRIFFEEKRLLMNNTIFVKFLFLEYRTKEKEKYFENVPCLFSGEFFLSQLGKVLQKISGINRDNTTGKRRTTKNKKNHHDFFGRGFPCFRITFFEVC